MSQNLILISCCFLSAVANANCQVIQVPNIQFSCAPSLAGSCQTSNTLGINCTPSQNIHASLSAGQSNSFSPRSMLSAQNNSLKYNIYLDANYQSIFGDGTQGTGIINTTCNGNCNFVLYSSTFGNNVQAGNYADNVILTVSY